MEKIKARVTAMVNAMQFTSNRAKKREFARLYAIFAEQKTALDAAYAAKNAIPDSVKTVTCKPSSRHEKPSVVNCKAGATSFTDKRELLQPARDAYNAEHPLYKGAISTKCNAFVVTKGKDALARREARQAKQALYMDRQEKDERLQKRLAKLTRLA